MLTKSPREIYKRGDRLKFHAACWNVSFIFHATQQKSVVVSFNSLHANIIHRFKFQATFFFFVQTVFPWQTVGKCIYSMLEKNIDNFKVNHIVKMVDMIFNLLVRFLVLSSIGLVMNKVIQISRSSSLFVNCKSKKLQHLLKDFFCATFFWHFAFVVSFNRCSSSFMICPLSHMFQKWLKIIVAFEYIISVISSTGNRQQKSNYCQISSFSVTISGCPSCPSRKSMHHSLSGFGILWNFCVYPRIIAQNCTQNRMV